MLAPIESALLCELSHKVCELRITFINTHNSAV